MIEKILSLTCMPHKIIFKVPKNLISVYMGNKRENINYIKDRFGFKDVSLVGEEYCSGIKLVA
jgi:hypothetical protein